MVDNENLKRLANQIKVLRARNNMTQEELSRASGVSACAITFIESCKKKPRVATIIKIAKALNVDENELLNYIF